jgi:hypothetical protein
MTSEERNKMIMKIVEHELIPLISAKGKDYSGEKNVLACFDDFGWRGVVVRIGDKYYRLKNFAKTEKLQVKNETIEDTIKDMLNYLFFALILYRAEKKGSQI